MPFCLGDGGKRAVQVALLENANEAPNAQFEKYVVGVSPRVGGKTLVLGAPKDGARYASLPGGLPAKQNVVAVESVVGPRERGGESYLLVYNAKGAASLEAAGTLLKAPAEILARREGEQLVVSVREDGWPSPMTEVFVQWPGEDDAPPVKANEAGEVRVPFPSESARRTGFVGIRAMVKEAKAGEADGKKYNAMHRWATLTFPIKGTKPAAQATVAVQTVAVNDAGSAKPFTQILRESYAHNHEVVGGAAFNKTLFAGKLTKAQLEVHLQQRALVHNELHRILIGSGSAKGVPYGAAQRNVLTLLFTDLINMGSGWPTEAQARPLTKAFLEEIRTSEATGPYFALGVQHIYFGGITNGGRMIGAKIGETIQFTPSYYEKSDGYSEYLAEVNKITDPAARAEMIRGGQAAYRYIIASSNEDVFKGN
jgi:hypothetical protein